MQRGSEGNNRSSEHGVRDQRGTRELLTAIAGKRNSTRGRQALFSPRLQIWMLPTSVVARELGWGKRHCW